eukprot:gene56987-biopygen38671
MKCYRCETPKPSDSGKGKSNWGQWGIGASPYGQESTVAAAPAAAKPESPTRAGPGASHAGGGAASANESPLKAIRRFEVSARAATVR